MKTLSEELIAARERIAVPATWTRNTLARNQHGVRIDPRSAQACKFCSAGALVHTEASAEALRVLALAMAHKLGTTKSLPAERLIAHFNDTRTYAEVLAAWDLAIALAKDNE